MSNRKNYDAEKFKAYLLRLVESRGTTMREASLSAGLDHGAIGRFTRGRRPHRDSCLLLADTLQVDPNEILGMAGYPPMPIMNRALIDPEEFPPDIKAFAVELKNIPPERRREIFKALKVLSKTDFVRI